MFGGRYVTEIEEVMGRMVKLRNDRFGGSPARHTLFG